VVLVLVDELVAPEPDGCAIAQGPAQEFQGATGDGAAAGAGV
jgi:hypothetical protein